MTELLLNTTRGPQAGIIVEKFEVDAGAGGTAQETAIKTLPAKSVLVNVHVRCTEAYDGATTKTFEVGLTGNTDKYIDPVDCPVTLNGEMDIIAGTNQDQKGWEYLEAALAIVATWTNVTGASAGKHDVFLAYIPAAD